MHFAPGMPRIRFPQVDGADAREVYIGIDAGSTTVKAVVIDQDENIISSRYLPNAGNPVPLIRDFLTVFTGSPPCQGVVFRFYWLWGGNH